ncbi:superoxide dismutase family protein [Lentibacillus amyloliquefaciens]|uniref:Superoxide dismutase [Cu-Zn] n=1 Tax=Lentibacillus amyloliquefaciens TaxID=1472767 RepID=A0A0U4GB55_9BACI|nr:superoxide dismutase family protein [Lentibacillus amyloliquefaciens]ALX49962.1 superoxide dismutase [Lentibacillus amyloliquefaciens]
MKRWILLLMLLMVIFVLAACGSGANNDSDQQNNTDETSSQQDEDSGEPVTVDLMNGDDESVGTAELEQASNGVNIMLEGTNIPKGTHGFHIHENGQCEAPDFKSAGGHFNPGDTDHGFDTSKGPHAGDLPNITVGEDGSIKMSYLAENVTLEDGQDNSLLGNGGTALVIHEGKDDGESQPSGDAGDRFACGTISQ